MKIPKLRFKEFSGEWEEKRLRDISDLTSSKRIFLSEYTNIGVPFYRGKEITELRSGKKISESLYISLEKYNEILEKYGVPQKNDILITAVGTLGNLYLIENDDKFYFKDGNLIWLRNIKCLSKYLFHNLDYNKKQILDSAIGSTQKALTIVTLNKLNINLPSFEEQEKIGNFLSSVDKKISITEEKLNLFKEYKKGMMQKIFKQEIRFKDENGNDYPDWVEKTLGEFLKESRIKGDTGENAKKLTVKLWGKGVVEKKEVVQGSAETQYYIRKAGQFIYGKLDFLNGAFGIIPKELDNYQSTLDSPAFDIDYNNINSCFLLNRVLQKDFYKKLGDIANGSRKAKRIHINTFLDMKINLPCLEEQEKIAKFLSSIDSKIENLSNNLENLKLFKKGLLQKMFI